MSTVVISPYSEEWPELFRQTKAQLLTVFAPSEFSGEPVCIEHIGSTSVRGLAAKPVIDVMLAASSLQQIEEKIATLGALGYTYVSKYEQDLPMRRYFVKTPANSLRIHLHTVTAGSQFWHEHIAFRDILRIDEHLRLQYQNLKQQLAKEFANDKSAYTDAKGPFIRAALAQSAR